MFPVRLAMAFALVTFFPNSALSQEAAAYRPVTPAQLAGVLKPGTFIVDVRMEGEPPAESGALDALYCPKCSHIRAPYDLDLGFLSLKLPRPHLMRSRNLLIVCKAGVRSVPAARELAKRGYHPLMLVGGLDAVSKKSVEKPDSAVARKLLPDKE